MYDDRPESFTFYRTMELSFTKHNYRRPIAGYQPIVEKITRDQLLDFYNNYYRPSNAVLVVVGDIDPDDAFKRIEDVYGGWESREVAVGESPVEPPQTEFRFRAHAGAVDHGYLGAGFHVPNILHEDYPTLEMISELLSAGKSSRLYRKVLEEKRLVTSVGADLLAEAWPGLFLFRASAPPEKLELARDAIFVEAERLKNETVGDDELRKARRQLERGLYLELETMEGQASNLGYYELLGDYGLADEHREAIKSVTPDQIRDVARKYFHKENCSLVTYLPTGSGFETATTEDVEKAVGRALSSEGGVSHMDGGQTRPSKSFPDAARSSTATVKGDSESELSSFTLDNGVRVLLKKRSAVPLVTMLTIFQGGGRLEPQGKSGVSTLTHRVLPKGTRNYDAEEIVRRIESVGGEIESYAHFDSSGVYLEVLTEYLDEALPIYKEVVREPLFNSDQIEQERARLLEELVKRSDNPIMLAIDTMYKKVFGDHPYSHPFVGDPKEVEQLTDRDCARWYDGILKPDNLVVSIVGDITKDRARSLAQEIYGDLGSGPPPEPMQTAPEFPVAPGSWTLTRKDLKQAVVLAGFTAPPMMTQDAISLEVLNGVLTGLGGRLFVELRDKRSLGYMTGSALSTLLERSIFFGYANPGADGVEEAFRVILHELDKVTKEDVTDEELHRSREWIIGSQIMQLQRNSSQASAYGTYEVLGFGYEVVDRMPELIRKVSKKDVREAAARVLDQDKVVMVKLLPEA
jgi:zinc protease